jgi:hypothetical protein
MKWKTESSVKFLYIEFMLGLNSWSGWLKLVEISLEGGR